MRTHLQGKFFKTVVDAKIFLVNGFLFLFSIPKIVFLAFILLYQKTISPDHGFMRVLFPYGFCKFHPTCSEYMYETVKRRGLFFGGAVGFLRILRCNPWSRGGIDHV